MATEYIETVEMEIVVVDADTCSYKCGYCDQDSRPYPYCALFDYRLKYVDDNEDNYNPLRCQDCKDRAKR
jgi:hypothetical protein